jgi:phenylalanyl-tRNA synthetase beta chain
MVIDMMVELTGGKPEDEILDIYPNPYVSKAVSVTHEFITSRLGIEVPKEHITNCLEALGFTVEWANENLEVGVPSFRANDVDIPEDIVEEVARIYGYHNIPSILMSGALPAKLSDSPFEFERKLKLALKALGATEVYTLSLVSKEEVGENALKLRNPLGKDSEYLRTSIIPSLLLALRENARELEPVHLFEVANIYIPREDDLPEEKMMLSGVLKNTDYRNAKGILEKLLEEVNSKHEINLQNKDDTWFYEVEIEKLKEESSQVKTFKPLPKYPPQVEDITLVVEPETKVGEIIKFTLTSSDNITAVDLATIYENTITLRVEYQDQEKTLTDAEVSEIRTKLLEDLKEKFGATIKE